MSDYNRLIEILNKHGLNGTKIVKAHKDTRFIPEDKYDEIDQVLEFLISKKIQQQSIEKYFSYMCVTTRDNVEKNYDFLINETKLQLDNLKKSLKILENKHEDLKAIYSLIKGLFGIHFLQGALNLLSNRYDDTVDIIKCISDIFGNLDIISQNGAKILYEGSANEIIKIMSIPQIEYEKEKLTYNKKIVNADLLSSTYENVNSILNIKLSDITGNPSDEKINLWEHPKYRDLLSSTIWKKNAAQVIEILKLGYWEEPRYQKLLTASIWNKDAEQIKSILSLKYWDDPRYQHLLSSNIFLRNADQIQDILELDYWQDPKYQHLFTSNIWHKTAQQIKDILNLKYWNNPLYKQVMTPSIWLKTADQIQDILELKYWQDPKYQTLLTPSMWRKKANQIKSNIEICEQNGLEDFSNRPVLIYVISSRELIAKINYLKARQTPLYFYDEIKDEYNLHPIFGMSNKVMKLRYGITKKELVSKYLNYNLEEESKHVL